MNNIEQIIKMLKKLDKSSIFFDKAGRRLLIKPPSDSLPNQSIKIDKDQSLIIQPHTNLFFNSLLHPEDRVPRKNLSIWIDELIKVADTFLEVHCQVDALSVATLYNQAALISCLMGNISMSQNLCQKQMGIFYTLAKEKADLLKYLLQPWINLGRIDRIIKAFDQSLEKFKVLSFLNENTKSIQLGKYSLNGNLLIEEIRKDQETYNSTYTCAFLDPIKTYLFAGRYSELIDFLNQESIENGSILLGIAYEASIIAHLYQGKIYAANSLVKEALIKVPPYLMPVFLLRQGGLYAICRDSRAEIIFMQILDYINYCDTHANNIHQAIFSTKAAGQFLRFGYKELAKEAYKKALSLCSAVDDELCTIECLEALNKLTIDKQYSDQLKQLVCKSGYTSIVQKYQPDKKSLESLKIKSEIFFAQLMNVTFTQIGRKLNA